MTHTGYVQQLETTWRDDGRITLWLRWCSSICYAIVDNTRQCQIKVTMGASYIFLLSTRLLSNCIIRCESGTSYSYIGEEKNCRKKWKNRETRNWNKFNLNKSFIFSLCRNSNSGKRSIAEEIEEDKNRSIRKSLWNEESKSNEWQKINNLFLFCLYFVIIYIGSQSSLRVFCCCCSFTSICHCVACYFFFFSNIFHSLIFHESLAHYYHQQYVQIYIFHSGD